MKHLDIKIEYPKDYVVNAKSKKECNMLARFYSNIPWVNFVEGSNLKKFVDETWNQFKENTCVGILKYKILSESKVSFPFESEGYRIIDFEEFLKINNISKEQLK
jgi:hypothetical protein